MDEERRTSRQPQGVHPCGPAARVLHQYRLPRPHRRRDPHLDGGRAGAAQGRDARREPGSRPTRTAMSMIGLACGFSGQGADRQGHVGAAGRLAAMLDAEGRAPERRGEYRLGAVADGGDAACDCTITRSTCSTAQQAAGTTRRRRAGRPPVACRCWCGRTGRPRRSSANSTTMRKASWAMWCAGSTRAWAARRCRTSTMWR